MRKSLFFIITLVICCFSLNVFAKQSYEVRTEDNLGVPSYIQVTEDNKDDILSTPLVDSSLKVYDFADTFSEDEKNDLYDKVTEFIEKYNMDMVIVTINDNPKSSAKAYAQDFYDYNTFGTNDTHDGILFLIDFSVRNVQIVTTGYAIEVYSDLRIDSILDDVFEYMSSDYYEAALAFVESASTYAELGPGSGGSPKLTGLDKLRVLPWMGILIFAVISTIIVVGIIVYNHKMVRKATSSRQFLVKDSLQINLIKETFLGTTVHKTARVQNDSSSGGGGSHTSSGSSGVSHGGSGRSF